MDATTRVPGTLSGHAMKDLSRPWCTGCRRLRSRAWRSTPGTVHLERILFNEKMEELRREALLRELRQRIRDVRQGPDGLLYLLTDEREGAVLRIEPAE